MDRRIVTLWYYKQEEMVRKTSETKGFKSSTETIQEEPIQALKRRYQRNLRTEQKGRHKEQTM